MNITQAQFDRLKDMKAIGFSNSATAWVNEHCFSGIAWLDEMERGMSISEAATVLKNEATEQLTTGGLSADGGGYIAAFLESVEWEEIAQSMYDLLKEFKWQ
jgi:hypothetical protein